MRTLENIVMERAAGRCECRGQCGAHGGKRCTLCTGQSALYEQGAVRLLLAPTLKRMKPTSPEHLRAVCGECKAHWNPWRADETRRSKDSPMDDKYQVYLKHLGPRA